MSISKLIRHFEALGRIPVPMTDVVSEFRKLVLHSGVAVKGVNIPWQILRGTHYSYHHAPSNEQSTILPGPMSMVVYSTQQSLEWQRLVCCKELVHVLDLPSIKTTQMDDVIKLCEKLSDRSRSFKDDKDLQWLFDDLAIYQALAILFPFGLREDIMGAYKAGRISDTDLADGVQIPVNYIPTVMGDVWKDLRETFLLPD